MVYRSYTQSKSLSYLCSLVLIKMIKNQGNDDNKKIYQLGSKLALWFILMAILGFVILLLPYFFEKLNFQTIGLLGNAVGGFLTPIVGISAALLTFLAFYVQYQANEQLKKQISTEQTNSHFYKMLDIHIKNVESFNIKSFRYNSVASDMVHICKDNGYDVKRFEVNEGVKKILDKKGDYLLKRTTDSGIPFKIEKNNFRGRNCFVLMVKDLHFILSCVNRVNNSLETTKVPINILNNFGFKVFFWGINSDYITINPEYYSQINEIKERLINLNKSLKKCKGARIVFEHQTIEKYTEQTFNFIPLSGHSSRLAHYFRHLYQTVKQLHESFIHGHIDERTLNLNLNTLRAQLSNEEQLLLYYNFRIGFGDKWDKRMDFEDAKRSNYRFLTTYRMIHNIPLYDTISKFVEHPLSTFRNFIEENKDFDLFEWYKD